MADDFDELYGEFTDDALDQIDLLSQIPSAPKNCDIESLLQIASHDEIQKAIDKLDMQHAMQLHLASLDEIRRLRKQQGSHVGETTILRNRVKEVEVQITIVKKEKSELNMQLKKAQQARSVDATMPFKDKEIRDLKRKLAEEQDSKSRATVAAHSDASLSLSRATDGANHSRASAERCKEQNRQGSIKPPSPAVQHAKRSKRAKQETLPPPCCVDQSTQTDDKLIQVEQHSVLRGLFHDETAIRGIFELMQSCENDSKQRFALFGCLCQDISGHRASATAFLAHLQPFIDGGHAKDMGLFHHALVVLRVLIYSSDVVLHNILGLETDGSNHEEGDHRTLPALVAAVACNLEPACDSKQHQSSICCLIRILHTLAAECPAKSRSVFSGLLDGTLDLLIASTATPSTTTPLLTSEYEMSKLGIEIVGHLLQCPELAIKVWKSDQPLPRRIIHVAQKVPQLRAAAVQLLCMVVAQDGGLDALLGVRDGGHLEYKSLVPTFVYWLYSEASKEENSIGVSLVQRLIAIFGAMKKRIQVKPLLHSVRHILIWSIKRLKHVQYKLMPNLSEYEIRSLQDLLVTPMVVCN